MSINWPDGYAKLVLDEVDSTNAYASRISEDTNIPTWVLGLNQTGSKARRGRAWAFQRGNFAASLLLKPTESIDQVALRSFVAAIALYDAVAKILGDEAGLALKWPNDLLLNHGKLAGILLESAGKKAGQSHLIIGIGVNLVYAPERGDVEPNAMQPVDLMSQTNFHIAPETFLDVLARSYDAYEQQFTAYGFSPIRTAWLSKAAKIGEKIVARTTTQTYHGIFETISDTGMLVLQTENGQVDIAAADVFFGS